MIRMGGAAKAASAVSTLLLMFLAFDVWTRYTHTIEYTTQQLAGSIWAFFTGATYTDPNLIMTIMIVILGVVSIAGALKG